jgi:cyclopropane-fatty-acyl-phospholipid synthase
MLLARLCKALIRDGALTLIDAGGVTYRFGRPSRAPDVVVRLHDRSLPGKLARSPLLSLGEAYADGSLTVEVGDVYTLLDLCARNLERWMARPEARALDRARRLARTLHEGTASGPGPRAPSEPRDRAAAHPDDRGDALHEYFLDRDRQHSCAYFADPRMTLDEAQEAKKRHLAGKLLLRPGQKVLDVGSGWGGFALYLAEAGGVDVTGITPSAQQLAVARQRAAAAELAAQVSFHQRELHQETGTYDRVVSVAVLEHVGPLRYRAFFRHLGERLTEDGVAVVHCICRMDGPGAALPWLRDPASTGGRGQSAHRALGAHAPALSELLPVIERERLWVTDVEILRLHYAETLRHWRRRLVSNWERASELHGARCCRRRELDLALGEASFRRGGLMVAELQLAKRADAVPLTREYMYGSAQARGYEVGLARLAA